MEVRYGEPEIKERGPSDYVVIIDGVERSYHFSRIEAEKWVDGFNFCLETMVP